MLVEPELEVEPLAFMLPELELPDRVVLEGVVLEPEIVSAVDELLLLGVVLLGVGSSCCGSNDGTPGCRSRGRASSSSGACE